MDLAVVTKLESAGIDKTFATRVPMVLIERDENGRLAPVGEEVGVVAGSEIARVTLAKITSLYRGTKTPPSFRHGPPAEYVPFFACIEGTVIAACRAAGRPEYDEEIERLYSHLRRRPDGRDANPLFSYMQAAARLYMSAFDVSQAEVDAVCRRLSLSAGHFKTGPTSTNYCEIVSEGFLASSG